MALTPQEAFNEEFDEFETDAIESELSETTAPSKTWRIDFDKGRLTSAIIDGKDAVQQMVALTVQTPRSRHYIYSDDMGISAEEIMSANQLNEIAADEIAQDVAEALELDDRIDSVVSVDVDITDGVATIYPELELVSDGSENTFESEVE